MKKSFSVIALGSLLMFGISLTPGFTEDSGGSKASTEKKGSSANAGKNKNKKKKGSKTAETPEEQQKSKNREKVVRDVVVSQTKKIFGDLNSNADPDQKAREEAMNNRRQGQIGEQSASDMGLRDGNTSSFSRIKSLDAAIGYANQQKAYYDGLSPREKAKKTAEIEALDKNIAYYNEAMGYLNSHPFEENSSAHPLTGVEKANFLQFRAMYGR